MAAFRLHAIITAAVSVKNGPFVIARVDAMVPSLFSYWMGIGIVLVTVQFSRFSISSGRDSLFETGRFNCFSLASGLDGCTAFVSGRNGIFRIPNIDILAQFQRILRFFRDFLKYCGFIAVIAIGLRFDKISRYRDDRD